MESADVLGFVAGTLTTIAFVPQVIKIWRSKHARDISTGTFAIFSSGVLLWLLYGIRLGALPIILANGITLVLSLTILVFKLKYK
jgi:MtN3 and saliva related transmembrane protein